MSNCVSDHFHHHNIPTDPSTIHHNFPGFNLHTTSKNGSSCWQCQHQHNTATAVPMQSVQVSLWEPTNYCYFLTLSTRRSRIVMVNLYDPHHPKTKAFMPSVVVASCCGYLCSISSYPWKADSLSALSTLLHDKLPKWRASMWSCWSAEKGSWPEDSQEVFLDKCHGHFQFGVPCYEWNFIILYFTLLFQCFCRLYLTTGKDKIIMLTVC